MQPQGFSGRAEAGRRRGQLALITFVLGGALGVTFGWSASRVAMPQVSLGEAPAATGGMQAIETPKAAAADNAAGRRSIVVAIPEHRAYVKSSSIPVAGMAFGRPHGPRIRSVQVELYVAGALLERAELGVFSSRFAGVIELQRPVGRTDAELRISDPTRPTGSTVVRHLTIDTPPSLLGPTG